MKTLSRSGGRCVSRGEPLLVHFPWYNSRSGAILCRETQARIPLGHRFNDDTIQREKRKNKFTWRIVFLFGNSVELICSLSYKTALSSKVASAPSIKSLVAQMRPLVFLDTRSLER